MIESGPTEGLFGHPSKPSKYDSDSHALSVRDSLDTCRSAVTRRFTRSTGQMTTLDDLWYLATQADQRAEQTYHRLTNAHDDFLERTYTKRVSRRRFRTLAERIEETGTPYGAHSVVYRPSGELLLVWHEGVEMWVVPGGEIQEGESLRETAERELREEAGVEAAYDGLALMVRVSVECSEYSTWGILPLFEGRAETTAPAVDDPDGEITDAGWFADLPENTRDREDLLAWREHALE